MKRFVSFFTVMTFLVAPFMTHAATVSSGDLIKASGPTVYYLGADQKRYVFPTDKTYFSWYSNFSDVKMISDGELASYALGGNVTYRPGVKMVKITTDPKVYAVDQQGTLRWVQTEQVATSLYGADWAKKIDDIPDAFFVNYKIGATIATLADFNPTSAQAAALSINFDKQLIGIPNPPPTPPTPPPTPPASYTASISASETTPTAGKLIQLTGTANPAQGIGTLNLFFDNNLLKSCEFSPCASDVTIPLYNTKAAYEIRTETHWNNGRHAVATSTISPITTTSSSVTLTLTRNEVRPNQTRSYSVMVGADFDAKYITVYVDGNIIHECTGTQQCQFSDTENSPVGTAHQVYAQVRNVIGEVRQTPIQTLNVVSNDHPQISVSANKMILAKGETVEITVSGSDDDGISWTEIWLNSGLMKHCASPTCNLILGPWNQSQVLHLSGAGADLLNLSATSTPLDITIQ